MIATFAASSLTDSGSAAPPATFPALISFASLSPLAAATAIFPSTACAGIFTGLSTSGLGGFSGSSVIYAPKIYASFGSFVSSIRNSTAATATFSVFTTWSRPLRGAVSSSPASSLAVGSTRARPPVTPMST